MAEDRALDLGQFLDHETPRADFGDYALNITIDLTASDLGLPNEVAYGIPMATDHLGPVVTLHGALVRRRPSPLPG